MKSPELSNKKKGGLFIASGSTHPELARQTAEAMGMEVGSTENKRFPNTELYVRYNKSIRGKHVIIMQTHAAVDGRSVNDSIQEQLIMIDAAKRASARSITAVCPYLAYQRQDRKARGREAIAGALIIKQLFKNGAKRIVSVDLHADQMQGVTSRPFDPLTAQSLLRKTVKPGIKGHEDEFVLVSPDGGRAKDAQKHSDKLDIDVIYMTKSRPRKNSGIALPTRPNRVQGVDGRTCIIFDDMTDTAGTLTSAAETLNNSGAKRIIALACHGIFSEPAYERIANSPIDELIVTDTIPQSESQETLGDRLTVIPIAPLIGQTLIEIVSDGSVSKIFKDQNHG